MPLLRLFPHAEKQLLMLCIVGALGLCFSSPIWATKNTSNITISFERYVLDNGLTVIIHEDHSDPVAHVNTTYHVGSAREQAGKSGFAHLFEHMMFQGSEHVADEEYFKTITAVGGSNNGFTTEDRTTYHATVPVNHLETLLWLEADRMGFFLDAITEEKFATQRDVVKNEKRQHMDNAAYGKVFEIIPPALYPDGHPYAHSVIGTMADLDRASTKDLQDFFLRWYSPNNATLTIGGDIDPQQVLKLVKKYFGGIARGPAVQHLAIANNSLDIDRYISYYDDKIQFPAVTFSFTTVPILHADAPALDCLAAILGNGQDSYLFQNLVATQKAINASARHIGFEHAGQLFMFVLPYTGSTLADFEAELRATLQQFEQAGVSDDDLLKYKAQFEANAISSLATVAGKVGQLAWYETFAGDAGAYTKEIDRHLAITREDVMRVYQRYIKDQPAVILSVLPDPAGIPAQADNFKPQTEAANPFPITDYSDLVYHKAKDDFDRSIKPAPQMAKLVTPPNYWQYEADNGIRVIGSRQTELPEIWLSFALKGSGYLSDSLTMDKLGLASVTSQLMNASTLNFSEPAMAAELEKIGSFISFSMAEDATFVTVHSLSKHIDRTPELLQEKLFSPAFKASEFARIRKQYIEVAEAQTREADSIANMVYDRLLYGNKDIRGIPPTVLMQTLPQITLDDVKGYYKTFYSPQDSTLVVVGDIEQEAMLEKLDFLLDWQQTAAAKPMLHAAPEVEQTTLYFAHKAGATQTAIRLGYLTDLPYDLTSTYFKAGLMNFTLGRAFNSRLNLNLREDKGITYGARSRFDSSDLPGPYTVSTAVTAAATGTAIREIMGEITAYAEQGITDAELAFMRSAVAQRDALAYETNQQKLGFLATLEKYQADKDYTVQQQHIINTISKAEINGLARNYLPLDQLNILVVGDRATVWPQLAALGYPLIELTVDGTPVTDAKQRP
ncbi:MAG: insulinase family protein [Oceanospirillaceae bacterium]|nr:insulinase family protein [Oceanospirillaceae bacterium]